MGNPNVDSGISGVRQEAGGRRQEAGGRRQREKAQRRVGKPPQTRHLSDPFCPNFADHRYQFHRYQFHRYKLQAAIATSPLALVSSLAANDQTGDTRAIGVAASTLPR
jgi:hypothetical protein